ncbi:hypothetical protein HDA32_005735 [Spinactinospora alkalitolerans]|uniref:DUF4132 domain-containing protein n=1 Tax=Spinactinospora alkalitolerans TaxID=687207 RepID=A0A852U4Z5_9ACTN|nr:DUF4132 domain-containing protein [Spinactinospora alkalitolerans]NYE50615.1 hypothetical protein [Spinactinospora alkalitolerans]
MGGTMSAMVDSSHHDTPDGIAWVAGPDGYGLALSDTGLQCRNPKGRVLKRTPKHIADSEIGRRLERLRAWLAEHETECRRLVRKWTRGSWPVPVALLGRLWPDPTWQRVLKDAAVRACDERPLDPPLEVSGLLREIDGTGRVGVLTLDAETAWLETSHLVFPHPRHLTDLEEVRDLAVDLGIEPGTDQLVRSDRPLESYNAERLGAERHRTWRRGHLLGALIAPAGVDTALSVDADGHPAEQAVRARTYRHPALGGRPVVRLSSDTEAPAADLRAERVGCAPAVPGPPVSAARRPALLGYPAWAVVHDPDRADVALRAFDLYAGAREEAAAKPGRAFDTLRAFARHRLPFSHLPAFWAQARQVFADIGNHHWAGQCRRAVQESLADAGMAGDLELRRALLREGLDDLDAFCAVLAEHEGPEAAYEEFRSRALRGFYNENSLFRDLNRFAKAAGKDPAEEKVRNLGEFFAGGGSSGSDSFWKQHRTAIVRLARTDDAFLRKLVLGDDMWLTHAQSNGVLQRLLADEAVARRLRGGVLDPPSSVTEWLGDRLVKERARGAHASPALLELLAFFAPTLIAEDEGLRLAPADDDPVDPNALDIALEHRIPLARPVAGFSLTEWYRSGEEARRPLAHVAADPRCTAVLEREIGAFEDAPEPATERGYRRRTPPPFKRDRLLDFPALAPIVTRLHPELAPKAPAPANEDTKAAETAKGAEEPAVAAAVEETPAPPSATDSLLMRALSGLHLHAPDKSRDPGDQDSTLRSLRSTAARLRGEEAPPEDLDRPALHWALLIERIGAVALRAASPATPPDQRAALIEFLRAWAELPFAADPARGWQYGALDRAFTDPPDAVVLHLGGYGGHYSTFGPGSDQVLWFVRPAPESGAADPLGEDVVFVRDIAPGWGGAEQITAFCDELARRGPIRWGIPARAAAERLADRLEITPSAATLVLNGFPSTTERGKPLDDHQRRALKAKVRETTGAQTFLARLDSGQRLRLAAAVPPGDPARLWAKDGPDDAVERVEAVWRGEGLPSDRVDIATTLTSPGYVSVYRLAVLQSPRRSDGLTRDPDSTIQLTGSRPELPSSWLRSNLEALVQLLPWAATRLPVGHPAARELPAVLGLLRERLRHPDLVLKIGWTTLARRQKENNRIAEEVFGPDTLRGGNLAVYDDGVFVVGVHPRYPSEFLFRPARLTERWDEPDIAMKRRLLTESYGDFAEQWAFLELLFSDGYTRLAERAVDTPVPEGHHEADPARSAPDLVVEVGGTLGVGADAAALYLQLAALTDPTDANVRAWNGWTPERHEQARRELLGTGAVVVQPEREVEADLAVEGRTTVLPGGLTRVRGVHPYRDWVMEEGKRGLYPSIEDFKNRGVSPLAPGLVHRPLHEMFDLAWRRTRDD